MKITKTETEYHDRIATFYNSVMPFYNHWKNEIEIEERKHPYDKFARNGNDRLYHSFKKRTEQLECRFN